MNKQFTAFGAIVILLDVAYASDAVRTAKIFSDHMVLQQELPVPVWGKVEAGETVTVKFSGQTAKTQADREGRWKVWLKPLKANSSIN